MTNRIRITVLLALTVWSEKVGAQLYPMHAYSVKDGLVQSEVRDIIQDKQGYLWIATFGGVSRFDGSHFLNFTSSNGLTINKINVIFQDSKGQIWFGTMGGGVNYLDKNRFRYLSKEFGLPDNHVNAIAEDREGNIWFGTDRGVAMFDGQRMKLFAGPDGKPMIHVSDILVTRKGEVYASTLASGCYRLYGGRFHAIPDAFSVAYNLLEDSKGRIWVSAQQGYSVIEGTQVRNADLYDVFGLTRIDHIMEDSDGNYWFSSYGAGVCKFDGRHYAVYNRQNGLSSNIVYSSMEDREGNIWFATYGGGLCKLGQEPFVSYQMSDRSSGTAVISIAQSPAGNMWFGILGGGIKELAHGVLYDRSELTKVKGASVWKMIWDRKGDQWIASNGGLDRISGGHRRHYTTSDGLNNIVLYDLLDSRDGSLWISTENGVNVFNGATFSSIRGPAVHGNLHARPLLKDSRGILWAGMYGGGIYKIQNGVYTQVFKDKGLGQAFVSGIIEDQNGNIWFSTIGQGLIQYQPGEEDAAAIHVFNAANDLVTDDVMSLALDSTHCLWMGTNRGVHMLNLVDFYTGKKQEFRYFGIEEGFSALECMRGAIYVDQNDHVWFGTIEGVFEYDPKRDTKCTAVPNIYISDVGLTSKSVHRGNAHENRSHFPHLPEGLKLPYDEGFISIEYAAIAFTRPQGVSYYYELSRNGRKAWSDETKLSRLSFSGLQPGHYTFSVKARSADGVFSDQAARFSFTVLPPFWKTWWFVFSAVLLLIALVVLIIRLRTIRLQRNKLILEQVVDERMKELKEEKNKKEMLLKEVHHRVKNNLQVIISLISLQSKYIRDKKALALFEECKNRIKTMALIHEKMYESADLANVNAKEYIAVLVKELISAHATGKFIASELDIAVSALDVDTVSPLGLLINEIVTNSLKHAFIGDDKGRIFIRFEQIDPLHYKLVIGDNGIGMPAGKISDQGGTLGMELIQSLVEQLEGTIERVKRPGTVYRIIFRKPNHFPAGAAPE